MEIKTLSRQVFWPDQALVCADIINRILQHLNANRRARIQNSALPLGRLFVARPIGMIGPVMVCFGVGHQTKDSSGWITDAGDVEQ